MASEERTRKVPGWEDCPVPVCFGGDPRALTFCCHPHYPLTFSDHCSRDQLLKEVGLSVEEYIKIKEEFTKDADWEDSRPCFKSLAYCCVRRRGCFGGRDVALADRYGVSSEESMSEYFLRKRALTIKLLRKARNKQLVEPYLKDETERLRSTGRKDILKLIGEA